jgi:hypothetical protein
MAEVTRLYQHERWTPERIGTLYGVTRVTVVRHLREAGVRTRSLVEAHQPEGRRPCPNSAEFRAYCLGFATGDLWVRRISPSGGTIEASCNTTHSEQVELMKALFESFGPVRTSGLTVRASLDMSFEFLLEKYQDSVPGRVAGDEPRAAYAAGYIDAEGSFGVYEGRARFKLDAYDVHVLHWLHQWCEGIGVRSRLLRIALAGQERPGAAPFRRDLWRVNVNHGPSLLRFIGTLEPFLRHGRRRDAMERARTNVISRMRARARYSAA